MAVAAWTSTDTAAEHLREFAEDVGRTLALRPKQVHSKYLVRCAGLPALRVHQPASLYRITRAEHELIERHAPAIISALPDPATFVELGSGSGEKLASLAAALEHVGRAVEIHLIDISPTALELSHRTLGRFPHVALVGHRSTFEVGLRRVATQRTAGGTVMVLLLGSNIGNFEPGPAHEFLCELRSTLRSGDVLLFGADLVKPEPTSCWPTTTRWG